MKLFYKVLREQNGRLFSAATVKNTRVEYKAGQVVKPKYGALMCFESMLHARHYVNFIKPARATLRIYECFGEEVTYNVPLVLLPSQVEPHGPLFWEMMEGAKIHDSRAQWMKRYGKRETLRVGDVYLQMMSPPAGSVFLKHLTLGDLVLTWRWYMMDKVWFAPEPQKKS